MSTLAEIESAVQRLPRREQELLFRQLAKRLGGGPSCYDLARELFEEPGRIGAMREARPVDEQGTSRGLRSQSRTMSVALANAITHGAWR